MKSLTEREMQCDPANKVGRVPNAETALSIWRKARPREYQQGAKAHADMRPDERCVDAMERMCPYHESTREWSDWTAGFLDAVEDAQVARFTASPVDLGHPSLADKIADAMNFGEPEDAADWDRRNAGDRFE